MNKHLQIFVKRKSFSIGYEYIVLICLVTITALLFFIYSLDKANNSSYETIGVLFSLITFSYFVVLVISNFFRHERLNGELTGHLIFEENKIHLGSESYNIADISSIEIENFYVKGKFNYSAASLPFTPFKSNGVKNYVQLFMKNGENEICYFLQTKESKVQMFSDVLKIYYRFGLLDKQNYLNIIEPDN